MRTLRCTAFLTMTLSAGIGCGSSPADPAGAHGVLDTDRGDGSTSGQAGSTSGQTGSTSGQTGTPAESSTSVADDVSTGASDGTGEGTDNGSSGGASQIPPDLLYDGFESADMSASSGFNRAGFAWESNNRTSVVTMSPECGGLLPGDATVVFNNGPICNGPIEARDWTAREGEHSLRFRFAAGEPMTEQRFNFGEQRYPDLWIRYWLRVPEGFVHGGLNNKLLALWVDTYDIPGDVTWQTRPDGTGGASVVYSDGGVTSAETDPTPFISVPRDQGRWMQLAAHYASASAPDAHDGTIELYRRWDGDSEWTLLHQKLDADTFEIGSSTQGIGRGYFMGWANDPYASDTEWLMDELEMSTDSLIAD